mmetsp:Transcript_3966/g.10982  ORF Transcript_3966/g.10982 Transcript_3966/m.10982 type:complete len:289 (-) Transcript_3966:777-1643(-)
MLHVATVRHTRRVLTRDVRKVVDSRWKPQAELFDDAPIVDDPENASRCHCCELLQLPSVPGVDVQLRHADVAPGQLWTAGAEVNTVPTDAIEAQDGAYHVHQAPDLFYALALAKVLDEDAIGERHQADLTAADVLRLVIPDNLFVEVRCTEERVTQPRAFPRRIRRRQARTFGLWRDLGRALEVTAQQPCQHAQQDDPGEVTVLRLLVPPVELRIVQPEGQCWMPGITWKWVKEPCARRQLANKLPLKRHRFSQLERLLQDLVAHAFQLQPREVPDLRNLILLKVLID